MKKVLCIDYFFPPLIGGWWIGLGRIKFLPEFGWQPIVVTAAETVSYPKDYSLLKGIPDSIEVHRVGHSEPSRELTFVRQQLRLNFIFPDRYQRWYYPALREARKILRREKVDLIYSVSAPYTCHFIAMKLKKEFNIPWITEWGDPWTANEYSGLFYDRTVMPPLRQLQKFLFRKGERDILLKADKSIVDCEPHQQQLCDAYGLTKEKIELITDTGYDEGLFTNLRPLSLYPGKLTIIFLGSVYPQFMEIIKDFLKVVNEVDKDIEVAFVGQGSTALQDLQLENLTCILHLVREKALAFALGSDFLFIVMPPNAKWIPGKLFEYLRLGKPILGLVPEDGDPGKIIKKARAGFLLSYDKEEMKQQLKGIFNQWKEDKFKDFHPDSEYIAQFERRKLAEKMVAIFNKVV